MPDLEGQLTIRLRPWAAHAERVTIRSSRRVGAASVFVGRSVVGVLDLLPSLFSVCATAQACAGVLACEQALGVKRDAAVQARRGLLVDLETVKEHLWRVLLDWPVMLGLAAEGAAMARVLSIQRSFRAACCPGLNPLTIGGGGGEADTSAAEACLTQLEQLCQEHIFGRPPAVWSRLDTEAKLVAWAQARSTPAARLLTEVTERDWQALGQCRVDPLPWLVSEELEQCLGGTDAEAFAARPLWQGRPRETTPFTRTGTDPLVSEIAARRGNGLLVRLVARLVELAAVLRRLRRGLKALPPAAPGACPTRDSGVGLAQVEAARGRLAHRVELEGGSVRSYRILAPTEWNFHPQGVVSQALASLEDGPHDRLRRQAGLLIEAVDPCVAYELSVEGSQ